MQAKKNDTVENRRKLFNGFYDYAYQGFPINILSIGEDEGVSIKASIQEFGPVLLSKILGLNNVQSGIISIAFKYCEDKQLSLNTIADLKYFLTKKTMNILIYSHVIPYPLNAGGKTAQFVILKELLKNGAKLAFE